ncbi:MAG: hypothetical protein IT292_03190 [Deltaproteobacteria bacterium]|nr:hypothetical protein [Deltaproteobacteria bacterium]
MRSQRKSKNPSATRNQKALPPAPRLRWFYQKNNKLLVHPVNKTFEEVLWMTDREFQDWIAELRRVVVHIWDNDGIPPTVGRDEDEIIEQFEQIHSFPVSAFLKQQAGKPNQYAIRNTSTVGSAANQWFPTMMATKINDTSNLKKGAYNLRPL